MSNVLIVWVLLALLAPLVAAVANRCAPDVIARRVAASILAHPNYTQPGCSSGCAFFDWGYCGGLVMNGLYTVIEQKLLPPAQAEAADAYISAQLDYFVRTPGIAAHDILSGALPVGTDSGDCGDSWVSGINFLHRNTAKDMELVDLLAANFSMGCVDRLPDRARTFARYNGGEAWPAVNPRAKGARPIFVWADGSFMSMALAMRLVVARPSAPRCEWVNGAHTAWGPQNMPALLWDGPPKLS